MAYLIIILASLRITRLLMHDSILGEKETVTETTYTDPTGFRLYLHKRRYKRRLHNFVARLIECAWCTTVWTTPLTWLAYQHAPTIVTIIALMHVTALLAIAGDWFHRTLSS